MAFQHSEASKEADKDTGDKPARIPGISQLGFQG